jgi:hypothetical protein
MSTASVMRPAMTPLARRVRAYFAPVERVSGAPAIFDPAQHDPSSPPAPWLDLGWIENFRRSAATEFAPLRAGTKGAPVAQFRKQLEARVEFEFREWGKLQMALAAGSQHMNVLAAQVGAPPKPSGGDAVAAIAVQSGSTAGEIVVGAGAVDAFAAGDIIAVDADYTGQTGYVGAGIAAAYVRDAAEVGANPDYIRRATFNVARVASKTATSLVLAQPLLGGVPANAKTQKVVAFVDREGGSFFQEWSALFVVESESGGRVCFHYPRLQPAAAAQEERFLPVAAVSGHALRASFLALPLTDVNDSEQVVCFRSYFPAANAALY